MAGRDALKLGLIRRIGDGRSMNAWSDQWLPRDERLTPVTSLHDNAPWRVGDYIDHTQACWNVEKLEQFFLPMDIEVIRGIPLCTRNQSDFWA
jgi:hypothetical protein